MNAGRAFVGSLLVGVGIAYVLEALDIIAAGREMGRWWPAAIVVLGILLVIDRGRVTQGSSALMATGALVLLLTTGALGSNAWDYAWPVALIVAGIWLVVGWGRRMLRTLPDVETVDGVAVVASTRVGTRSDAFRHASLTAILGGVTLDLTDATAVPTGALVDATCVLGSITVLVPRGWLVDVRGIPLLGGWDDTTDRSAIGSGAPRLEVRALVALGGLEVKHAGRWSA